LIVHINISRRRSIVDPGFAELVDKLLLDAQPDDTYKRMATWASK